MAHSSAVLTTSRLPDQPRQACAEQADGGLQRRPQRCGLAEHDAEEGERCGGEQPLDRSVFAFSNGRPAIAQPLDELLPLLSKRHDLELVAHSHVSKGRA